MRPTWDTTWLTIAHTMAMRSACSRAKIGAVIVDTRQKIIATGYNGPPADWQYRHGDDCKNWCTRSLKGPTPETMTSYEDCPSVHAEMNALMHVDRRLAEGGTLYVTGPICFTCAKAVANSGIKRVVIDGTDEAAYRQPGRSVEFLRACDITVVNR